MNEGEHELNFAAEEALALAGNIAPLLAGRGPMVQGAALADLLATWLCGHLIRKDEDSIDQAATNKLRADLLSEHVATVLNLVKIANERDKAN